MNFAQPISYARHLWDSIRGFASPVEPAMQSMGIFEPPVSPPAPVAESTQTKSPARPSATRARKPASTSKRRTTKPKS